MHELNENEKLLLEQFYNQLNTITSLDLYKINNQLFSFDERLSDELELKIKTERKIFSYYQGNDGILISNFSEINFDDEEIEYLNQRLIDCENDLIKCRYAHVLWNQTKHNKYAKEAINLYLNIINKVIVGEFNINNISVFTGGLLYILKLYNGNDINKESIKNEILVLLKSDNIPPTYKALLLILISNNKIFKADALKFILSLGKNWIDYDTSTSLNEDILFALIKIAEKTGNSTSEFYTLLAKNSLLLLTQQHPDPKNFYHSVLLDEAAKFYKKAGNLEKYDEIMIKYSKAKRKIEMGIMSIDETVSTKELDEHINTVLKLNCFQILNLLSHGTLIKTPTNVTELNNFINSISIINFDINGNYKKNEKSKILGEYQINVNFCLYYTIANIMYHGMINGKFNYQIVYYYLKNYTWFGQQINRNIQSNPNNSTWLDILHPALYSFISTFEYEMLNNKYNILNNNKNSSYILCLDSLTLKFEGILRDYIIMHGGYTTTINRNQDTVEQLLDGLLNNPKTIECFPEEDINFFKYVFTDVGLNIRNNIAHSFYFPSNYTQQYAMYVFLCILRLGKLN